MGLGAFCGVLPCVLLPLVVRYRAVMTMLGFFSWDHVGSQRPGVSQDNCFRVSTYSNESNINKLTWTGDVAAQSWDGGKATSPRIVNS